MFLHGIDTASREQLLDLLCFLKGPGILSIVKDSLNRLAGKVPFLKDKIDINLLQDEIDEKRNELNGFTDHKLKTMVVEWLANTAGVKKKDKDSERISIMCLKKCAEHYGIKGEIND